MSYSNKPFEELDVLDNFLMNAIAAPLHIAGIHFCLVETVVPGQVEVLLQMGLQVIDIGEPGGTKGGNGNIKTMLQYLHHSTADNAMDDTTKELHGYVSRVKTGGIWGSARAGYTAPRP